MYNLQYKINNNVIFETSRYTNLQFKIIRKNSQTWMDPRLQFNTSDLKELPMDWKFLSKVTDSFFLTMTFGKVDILSQQICYPSNVCNNIYRRWQC